MTSRWKRLAAIGGLTTAAAAGTVLATPAVGTSGIVLVRAAFDEIAAKAETDTYEAELRTKGFVDVVVNHNKMAAGGTSGWHTHPGTTIVSIKSGSLTLYDADDPTCTARVYGAGTGFVDPGGGHVHIARNEGQAEAEWYSTYIIPRGGATRIDASNPGICAF